MALALPPSSSLQLRLDRARVRAVGHLRTSVGLRGQLSLELAGSLLDLAADSLLMSMIWHSEADRESGYLRCLTASALASDRVFQAFCCGPEAQAKRMFGDHLECLATAVFTVAPEKLDLEVSTGDVLAALGPWPALPLDEHLAAAGHALAEEGPHDRSSRTTEIAADLLLDVKEVGLRLGAMPTVVRAAAALTPIGCQDEEDPAFLHMVGEHLSEQARAARLASSLPELFGAEQ